ncbi:transposable element Tcb1 transposase [Trichonephila clavipes]|nr:transposable element Tcb1 transposase [Trichonephila clavipes]
MSRRKQRSAFHQVSEFDRGRIVAYRDCGLSFREIGSRVGRNQTTVMRICDRWMQEGTTDRRGRSHPLQCTTSREDRQIVRMAVKDPSVTSRTIALHIESVTHHLVSARIIRRRLQQSGLSARRPSHLSATPRWSDSNLETPWREDAEQLQPHWSCTGYYVMERYWISLSHSSRTHCRYFKQPALHLRSAGASCPFLLSGLGHSHISTG